MIKPLKTFLTAILLLCWFASVCYAQLKCKITHYSTEDGLSHNRVMWILKDRDGFMWFGTWNGLNRFDGHTFVAYHSKPGDTSSLRNDRIQEMYEDPSGYLWLRAYDNRVYRFDKKKEKFLAITAKNSKGGDIVFSRIILTKTGQVWLNTTNSGLFFIAKPGAEHPRYVRFAEDSLGSHHLPSNGVTSFCEDTEHNVWLNTRAGACLLKQTTDGFRWVGNNIKPASGAFLTIVESKNGVWLPTTAGALYFIGKTDKNPRVIKVSNNPVTGVCVSKLTGNIYLTSRESLITVGCGDFKVHQVIHPGMGNLYAMYEDRTGLLWIEPEKYGIIKYDPEKNSFKHFSQRTDAYYLESTVRFFRLTENGSSPLWVSMVNGGFGYYDKSKDAVDYFYNEPGNPYARFSNVVIVTYIDSDGTLWFSSDDKGVNKVVLQQANFDQRLVSPGSVIRSDNEIRGIYTDHLNRLWLASKSGGLYTVKENRQLPIAFTGIPPGGIGVVYKILEDSQNVIWLGTKGNGLFKAEPLDALATRYKLTQYKADKNDPYSLSSDVIYSLIKDKDDRLWIGTYEKGLNLMINENGRPRFLNAKNTFSNYPAATFQKVRHLQLDAQGRLWIASTDGLAITDPNSPIPSQYQFTLYSKIPGDITSLGNNDVQYIYRDVRDRMWIATSGGGIDQAIGSDPAKHLKFKVYTTADGLSNDYVLSCVNDKTGNLWISTENGLSRFNADNGQFKNYDSNDGLPKTGFSESSSVMLPDGRLVFGNVNGYITFDPERVTEKRINAPMVLSNLQVNNEDIGLGQSNNILQTGISYTQRIVLAYDHNIIGLDYGVLDYRSENKQSYAYRLKGFDNVWHYNKGLRRATYTNLPPGNYTFEVKCTNTNLYTVQPYKSLEIIITPPWWHTWWAYLLYFIMAAIALEIARRIVLTMLRLRQRVAIEKRLADLKVTFFTNVSHELRTPLTLILNPIEEIFKKEKLSNEGSAHIDIVRKNAKRMVHFINQLLDLRKMQSGKATLKLSEVEMVSFVKIIGSYFADVAAEKNITFRIESDNTQLFAWIDAEKIDVVIYNVLSNAFKFTPSQKQITVRLTVGPDDMTISVTDQGEGVPKEHIKDIFELYYEGQQTAHQHAKGTGIGLALAKEFVELHHGSITAQNNPEGGLTVAVVLKTGRTHFNQDKIEFLNAPHLQHQTMEVNYDAGYPEKGTVKNINSDKPLVLLVEDNGDLRKFLGTQLSDLYQVEFAADGEEGLRKALALIPDLILSDVMMPRMDGIQMLSKIKDNIETSHIPVVLLSARSSIEHQIQGLKYGADYYITKPFQNEFLLASISNLITQRKKLVQRLIDQQPRTLQLAPSEVIITSQDEIFLRKVIQIVEDNINNPDFNMDNACNAVNMSRSTFYKKFKSLTGQPPVEFIREMRLKRSAQLLEAGETNISDIAYTVGFSNNRYFSTCFKEYFGITPTEYLKKVTQKA